MTSFSMSITDKGIFKWSDLKCLLDEIFEKDNIRIFLCKNGMKYVGFSERDNIFDQFHN